MKIFANFKAYLDFAETNILVSQLLQSDVVTSTAAELALFPSELAFTEVEKALRGTPIGVGMQHISELEADAVTGEVHAGQAKEAGAQYVLVGHSERRHKMGETDQQVEAQFHASVTAGLIPVLCVGETAAELEAGERNERLATQLNLLQGVSADYIIAYEPVWAISGSGSGKICDPTEAAEVHAHIKGIVGNNVPVLYGGSVNNENVVSYISLPGVDGVLVGSASTRFDSFESLIAAVQ